MNILFIILAAASLAAILAAVLLRGRSSRAEGREMVLLGEQVLAFVRDFLGVAGDSTAVDDFVLARLELAVQADSAFFIASAANGGVALSGTIQGAPSDTTEFATASQLVSRVIGSGEATVSDGEVVYRLDPLGLERVDISGWSSAENPFTRFARRKEFRAMLCLPCAQGRAAICYKKGSTFTIPQIMAGRTTLAIADSLSIARQRLEEKAARSAFKASALISIGQNINSHLSLDRVLSLIVSYVGPMLGADGIFLFLGNQEPKLDLAAGWWKEHVFSSEEFLPIALHCFERGCSANFPDPSIDEAPEVPGVATPIMTFDRSSSQPRGLGVIICVRKAGEKRFTSEEEDFLMSFADQAAIAVRNAELYESLRTANEKLRELDMLKNEFLQIVSHDIRSPLSAFIGLVDTLLADEKEHRLNPEKREKILAFLIDRAQKISQATQESLSVAQIESGQLRIHLQATDVAALLANLDVKPTSNCRLILDIQPDLPLLLIDPERLRQVLNNLLDNAFKYSPAGGDVTLVARLECHPEPFLKISVRDQGLGFNPDEQRYLFKKFGRINNDKTAPIGGTGMGLYICRRIVEVHGGRIWGESEGEGRGCRFTFAIPAPLAPSAAAPTPKTEVRGQDGEKPVEAD